MTLNQDEPREVYKQRIELDNAREQEKRKLHGNYLIAADASSLSASVDIHIGSRGGDGLTFKQGKSRPLPKFWDVRITNAAQAGEWIELEYGFSKEPMAYSSPDLSAAVVQQQKNDNINTPSDTTVANGSTDQILASNSSRHKAYIQNLDGSITIRMGGSGVGASSGLKIPPEEIQEVPTDVTSAIHVHNPGGSAVNIAAWELED